MFDAAKLWGEAQGVPDLVQRQVDEKLVDQLLFGRGTQLQGVHGEATEDLAEVQFMADGAVAGLEALRYLRRSQIVEDALILNAPGDAGVLSNDVPRR